MKTTAIKTENWNFPCNTLIIGKRAAGKTELSKRILRIIAPRLYRCDIFSYKIFQSNYDDIVRDVGNKVYYNDIIGNSDPLGEIVSKHTALKENNNRDTMIILDDVYPILRIPYDILKRCKENNIYLVVTTQYPYNDPEINNLFDNIIIFKEEFTSNLRRLHKYYPIVEDFMTFNQIVKKSTKLRNALMIKQHTDSDGRIIGYDYSTLENTPVNNMFRDIVVV